jgi:hypothetical protein
MAKKKLQKISRKEGDVPFKFPEFDQDKFLEDEFRSAKTTFIAAGLGLGWGIVAAMLYGLDTQLWPLIFVLGLLVAGALRALFIAARLDLEEIGAKGMAGSFAVYFFTMVAVWILLINPPFSDFQKPVVLDIEMQYQAVDEDGTPVNSSWVKLKGEGGSYSDVMRPANLRVRARVADNDELDRDMVEFELLHAGVQVLPPQTMEYTGDDWFEIVLQVHDPTESIWRYSQYDFKIFCSDMKGHSSSASGEFLFSDWAPSAA